MVSMSQNGERTHALVHRLIAEAFLGPAPQGKPLVLHWDDNPTNNRVSNLRWGDLSDNQRDAVRNGTHASTRKTDCKRGHPLEGDNLHIGVRGERICKTCRHLNFRRNQDRYATLGLSDPEDPRHGTAGGFSTYKCRCGKCREWKRKSDLHGKIQRSKKTLPDTDPRHGTYSCYKVWSCRCDRCKRANADYEYERKRRVKNEQS